MGFFDKGQLSDKIDSRSGQKGQVAILFALVFTFLFILFGFVVDFAHLVNNKINLQIAADQAAYAGAAWQARLMNRLGMINYRMRQDVKELAMRVNVTHLRHNRNYPRGNGFIGGGHQRHSTEPFICQQAHGYRALAGLTYAQDTNLCKNASPSVGGLPPIVVPPVIANFDPFAVAIAAQIRRIQQAANQECRAAANDNRILAQHLVGTYSRRSQFHARQAQAMAGYINQIANETDAESSEHPAVRAAYQSALRNLTLSNNDEFRMEVLRPDGGQLIQLEEQRLRGTIFFINFQVEGNGCVGRPNFLDFNNMVAGFSKEQSLVTYFSVKLTSRPRMFFMPSAWVDAAFPELVAFASAKPFGSRLGPAPSADQLLPIPNRPGNQSRLINFSWVPGDGLGLTSTKRMSYLDALHPFNGIGRPDGNRQRGWPESRNGAPARLALRAIRAPSVFEAAFYTIFPDPGPNLNTDYPDTAEFAQSLYPDYLEAANHANDSIIQTPQPTTSGYLPSEVGSRNRGFGWIQINSAFNPGGPYAGYGAETPSSHSVTTALGLPRIGSQSQANAFGWAGPQQLHSGWTPAGKPGRIGYSVKFIGMDALTRTLRVRINSSGAQGPIANPPTGDDNVSNVFH